MQYVQQVHGVPGGAGQVRPRTGDCVVELEERWVRLGFIVALRRDLISCSVVEVAE